MMLCISFLMMSMSVLATHDGGGMLTGDLRDSSVTRDSTESDHSPKWLGVSRAFCTSHFEDQNNGMEWDESLDSCVCKPEMNVRIEKMYGDTSVTQECLKECPTDYYPETKTELDGMLPKCNKCQTGFKTGCEVCEAGSFHAPKMTQGGYRYVPLENEAACTRCASSSKVKKTYSTLTATSWAARASSKYDNADWKQVTQGRFCFCDSTLAHFNRFTGQCQPILCEGVKRFDQVSGKCVSTGDNGQEVLAQQAFLREYPQI